MSLYVENMTQRVIRSNFTKKRKHSYDQCMLIRHIHDVIEAFSWHSMVHILHRHPIGILSFSDQIIKKRTRASISSPCASVIKRKYECVNIILSVLTSYDTSLSTNIRNGGLMSLHPFATSRSHILHIRIRLYIHQLGTQRSFATPVKLIRYIFSGAVTPMILRAFEIVIRTAFTSAMRACVSSGLSGSRTFSAL